MLPLNRALGLTQTLAPTLALNPALALSLALAPIVAPGSAPYSVLTAAWQLMNPYS